MATPRDDYCGIENVTDFQRFVALCEQSQIRVTLANAWAQKLGEHFAYYIPQTAPGRLSTLV
jgi:hypothetical protein